MHFIFVWLLSALIMLLLFSKFARSVLEEVLFISEPWQSISYEITCVSIEDSDQPASEA